MKSVEISDQAFQAIASSYGDVAEFIEQAARNVSRSSENAARASSPSVLDVAKEVGAVGTFCSGKGDLATNPVHLEGFGK